MSFSQIASLPFGVAWRTAIARLPRAVPNQALHLTCPGGPYPIVLDLPSRSSKYTIPVYIFIPPVVSEDLSKRPPVVLDFHGGGFFLGSCLEQAPTCSHLARNLGAVVISVDYRMGPLAKFPAALEDSEDVLSAVLDPNAPGYNELRQGIAAYVYKTRLEDGKNQDHKVVKPAEKEALEFDLSRIALAGYSSGGNLALELALNVSANPPLVDAPWPCRFAAEHPHPIALLLYYPSLDLRQLPSERTRPPKMPATKSMWGDMGDTLAPTYLPREQAAHPRASPGLVDTSRDLHSKARVLLVLPDMDTLADQSEIWVKKVAKEGRGKDLRVERYPGMKHGWTQMPESWLNDVEKATRTNILDKTIVFTKDAWEGRDIRGNASI